MVTSKGNLLVFLSLYLFSSSAFATKLVGFCFKKGTNLSEVRSYLKPILAHRDVVDIRNNTGCIEINISPARAELFKNYLNRRYRVKNDYVSDGGNLNSLTPSNGKNCRIKLKRVGRGNEVNNSIQAGRKFEIKRGNIKTSSSRTQSLLLQENRWGQIRYNDQSFQVKCRIVGNGYLMTLSTSGDSGTQVSSEVQVSKGSQTEIGSTLDDLNDKFKSVGIPSGVDYRKRKGKSKETLYLIVE